MSDYVERGLNKKEVEKAIKRAALDLREKRPPIETTLIERNNTHGDFDELAHKACEIRDAILEGSKAPEMNTVQREALTQIATKLSRIVCGDPYHIDNWHDIAGYAILVEQELKK